jgi:protein-disulfide isomerase
MTCPHCAQFQNRRVPELKTKYIDTGQVRCILREFPLDELAGAASLLARCAGPDRYYPMIEALFETQRELGRGRHRSAWKSCCNRASGRLLEGEASTNCIGGQGAVQQDRRDPHHRHEKFGIDSTPSFFVNGKRMSGEHELKDFEGKLVGIGKPAEAGGSTPPAGALPRRRRWRGADAARGQA